ncbi:GntR family transcriptional regulator [Agromyces aureus]|uniref:HTH gntR-type domain-containing protein n=1 Tax=Agromyces aureus TaxID=453304 RepID=A0A191WH62_9MICO|nr:GntR family transcriptional regulator [Agromyces aureus]ANJ27513.1 hypothetical protein ATC03_13120 [Agromyces aureus]
MHVELHSEAHPAPTRISRSVLSDETYSVIRDMVLEHRIAPGNRVNIDSLSADLGVSPTPVREALARLESDGLVVKVPLRGYSTTPLLSVREFVELTQFRVLIEQWTASQASRSVDPNVARSLRAEIEIGRQTTGSREGGSEAFRALTDHDARFHALIATTAGNELIAQSFERTHFHLHFLRLYLASHSADHPDHAKLREVLEEYDRSGQVSRTIDNHSAIADAIIAGDADEASTLMRDHIELSRVRFLPVVELLSTLG